MRTLALLTCLVATAAVALAQEKAPTSRNKNKKETTVKQDETIRSQKERQARGPEYDRLEVLIESGSTSAKPNRWAMSRRSILRPATFYEWLPGKYWILHTAYGRSATWTSAGLRSSAMTAKLANTYHTSMTAAAILGT